LSLASGLLIVDKDPGITSHTVVGKVRRLLGIRRVGHTGTLDPIATGVLPVLFGRGTKLSELFMGQDKEYIARFRLGIVTDTRDRTGQVVEEKAVTVSEERVRAAVENQLGEQVQTPPLHSAIKVEGVKLYELARKGIEFDPPKRRICVREAEFFGSVGNGEYEARYLVTKGTYIRSLIHDLGQSMGCGAVMTELRRTRSGLFSIHQAHTIAELEKYKANLTSGIPPAEALLTEGIALSLEAALAHLPARVMSREDTFRIKNGVRIRLEEQEALQAHQPLRLLDPQQNLFALGKITQTAQGRELRLYKSLWP
jgi:tRNA pseudouridine55 synthase